jgi:hypothetical protein
MSRFAAAAVAFLLVLLALAPARPEEAKLRDGRTVPCRLAFDDRGGLHVTAAGKELPPADVRQVQFPCRATPFRAATLHEIAFHGGERLTGEIRSLDAESLRVRTAWKSELQIPRRAVAALAHFSGAVTFHEEDFEKEPAGWKLAGGPTLGEQQYTSGRQSLCLDRAGQEASFSLAQPLRAGRAAINFHDPGRVAGKRWLLAADFAGGSGPVTVELAGAGENYSVEASPAACVSRNAKPARAPGWHRLSLRFAPGYLIVGVDEAVVWSSAKDGPGGPLRAIRLRCEVADGDAPTADGAVCFDDFSLARGVDTLAHRVADPRQDELWLLPGDQLFGQVVTADRRTIRLQTRFGPQTVPWGKVRAIYFRQPLGAARRKPAGAHVHIGFHPGRGMRLDELKGTLIALDERRLLLRHAALGELEIDRARLGWLRLISEKESH